MLALFNSISLFRCSQ